MRRGSRAVVFVGNRHDGQQQREACAAASSIVDKQVAAMGLGQGFGERQADACAKRLRDLVVANLVERLEDALLLVVGHAGPVVADAQTHHACA